MDLLGNARTCHRAEQELNSHHDPSKSSVEIPLHAGCSKCHHFHVNHHRSSLGSTAHTKLVCEWCSHLGSETGGTSSRSSLASFESDSTFNQEWEVLLHAPTDTIKQSMSHVNQGSEYVTKEVSSGKRLDAGSIVRRVANIHRLLEDVEKNGSIVQKAFPDVMYLASKIQIRRVAFRSSCRLLLVTVARSRHDLDNMIEDLNHPIWKDMVAHRSLDELMASFFNVFLQALQHFQQSLDGLNAGLQAMRWHGKKRGTGVYRFWPNWPKSPPVSTTEELEALVQDMTIYNDIINSLIMQVVPKRYLLGSSVEVHLGSPLSPGPAQASHSHTGCIQRGSRVLYDALCKVCPCRDHETHSLWISLNFDYAKPGASFRRKSFHFDVAVRRPCYIDIYRLAIDSANGEFCTCQMAEENRTSKDMHLANRVLEPAERDTILKTAAQNRSLDSSELDADEVNHRTRGQRTGTLTNPESMQVAILSSDLNENLCHRRHKSSANNELKQEAECSCFGFTEINGISKNFSRLIKGEYQTQSSHSLDDILVRANSEHRDIPLEDRLRTASLLAAGVLHLHTSSCLPDAWSSKDILFFDVDSFERCTLGEPFLQTQLDSRRNHRSIRDLKDLAGIRSSLLSLGLVLLELAYSAPRRNLPLPADITQHLFEWEIDVLNLMRLSDTVSRQLGLRYARVVQTCLSLGLRAQGLGQAELNEMISEKVVKELDRCLSAMTF